jgi:hypothetical protein
MERGKDVVHGPRGFKASGGSDLSKYEQAFVFADYARALTFEPRPIEENKRLTISFSNEFAPASMLVAIAALPVPAVRAAEAAEPIESRPVIC